MIVSDAFLSSQTNSDHGTTEPDWGDLQATLHQAFAFAEECDDISFPTMALADLLHQSIDDGVDRQPNAEAMIESLLLLVSYYAERNAH